MIALAWIIFAAVIVVRPFSREELANLQRQSLIDTTFPPNLHVSHIGHIAIEHYHCSLLQPQKRIRVLPNHRRRYFPHFDITMCWFDPRRYLLRINGESRHGDIYGN
jgi:hypothetical protein